MQLVYRLYHPSGGLIDAISGEPLVLPGKWFGDGGAFRPAEKVTAVSLLRAMLG